jgi:hypothetical protein
LFPDETHILRAGSENPRPNAGSLRNDDTFRYDSARYLENIETGKHDPDWLRDAWVAHEKRKRGDFDDHQVNKFEKGWSAKVSPEHHLRFLRNRNRSPAEQGDQEDGTEVGSTGEKAVTPSKGQAPASPCAKEEQPSPEPQSSSSVERGIAEVSLAKEANTEG